MGDAFISIQEGVLIKDVSVGTTSFEDQRFRRAELLWGTGVVHRNHKQPIVGLTGGIAFSIDRSTLKK
jgi:hypothetical protein